VKLPYRLTEFDDLSRRYHGLLPDVVHSYKEQALIRVFGSASMEDDETPEVSLQSGVYHSYVMNVAEKIVLAKFTQVAKRRIPLNPRTKALKRRTSVHMDEIEKLADEKLRTPGMSRKRKAETHIQADRRAPTARSRRIRRQQTDSDKENKDVLECDISFEPRPIATGSPAKENLPQATTRPIHREQVFVDVPVTKPTQRSMIPTKRVLEELSPQSRNKRLRLDLSADLEDNDDSFSDASSLFNEELAKQNTPKKGVQDGRTTKQAPLSLATALLPSPPETLPSPKEAGSERGSANATPTSSVIAFRAMLKPFIREAPAPLKARNPALAFIQPKGRVLTCFRVAEALRFLSKELHAPVPVNEVGNEASITVELYAKIQLTYRHGLAQMFVFTDIFFPGKPPFLHGRHASWRKCQQQLGRMLEAKVEEKGVGGELCRAVVIFSIDRSRKVDVNQQAEGIVLSVRPADWEEVRRVRGIVEPRWQDASCTEKETGSSRQHAAMR
jgi:hypothetical protein